MDLYIKPIKIYRKWLEMVGKWYGWPCLLELERYLIRFLLLIINNKNILNNKYYIIYGYF